jgi:hypothetical protein
MVISCVSAFPGSGSGIPARETLIKLSLSTARIDTVKPDELANQAEDTGNDDRL